MIQTADDIAVRTGDHLVYFYEHDRDLARTVSSYVADGARAGAAAVVIATEPHRRALEAELAEAGIDLSAATIVWLDAAATLESFMPRGEIDAEAFHRVVGAVLRDLAQRGPPIRAFGEMVALLWDAGDVLSAIKLEEVWNELSNEIPFSLLCAYRRSSVSDPADAQSLECVCHLHSSVELSRRFDGDAATPHAVRRFVAGALRQQGFDQAVVDDAQLIASELATNAIVHARSPLVLTARTSGSRVRLCFEDRSSLRPAPRPQSGLAASGHGLHVVAALADRWAVADTDDGKVVWAELAAR